MASPRPSGSRFIGRARELALIDAVLDGMRDRPHVPRVDLVEIAGDPGIGKTRLLGELLARARGRGHLVLGGRAGECVRGVPCGAIVEALDDHLAALGPERLAGIGADRLETPRAVFPALAAADLDVASTRARPDPRRLHRDMRLLLDALARSRGLVLAVDDAHWIDGSSLDLIARLLRQPPAGRLLVALAYRPRQVGGRLAGALARARHGEPGHRIDLAPLPPGDARRLLGPDLPAGRFHRLYEESGGNPFYMRALARIAARERSAPAGGLDVGEPTADVRAVLLAELETLPAAVRGVAGAAAVAGEPFDIELVAAAAAASAGDVAAAMAVLVARDLVRPDGSGTAYRFRHRLVGQVAYAAAGARRLSAHARTARALEERGAPIDLRAHHLDRGARAGDEAAPAPGAAARSRAAGSAAAGSAAAGSAAAGSGAAGSGAAGSSAAGSGAAGSGAAGSAAAGSGAAVPAPRNGATAPAGGRGYPGLTRRESEVAGLVAQGRTNREIADLLTLSRRTVETHVASIFTKLGVSSRVAVATTLARRR